MTDTKRKINAFVRRERLRNLLAIVSVVLVISVWYVFWPYEINHGEWRSSEVTATMQSIVARESDNRAIYLMSVKLESGKLVQVPIPQSSHFKQGGTAVLVESENVDSGKKKYRYLRPGSDS